MPDDAPNGRALRDEAIHRIADAQNALFQACRTLQRIHPGLAATPEYKECERLAKQLQPLMQSIARIPT